MTDDAARPREFGTGLRARLERDDVHYVRPPSPRTRDLTRLCTGERDDDRSGSVVLVGRDLGVHGASGAFAA